MEEEKKTELNIEEMKNAVAMATFLPEMTRIIQDTNNRVAILEEQFKKQALALNDFVKSMQTYVSKVEELIKIDKSGEACNKIDSLTNVLNKINDAIKEIKVKSSFSSGIVSGPKMAKEKAEEKPKTTAKPKENEKKTEPKQPEESPKVKEFKRCADALIKCFAGRNKILVTKYSLKNLLHFSDEMITTMFDFLEKNKCYQKDTSMAEKPTKEMVEKYARGLK